MAAWTGYYKEASLRADAPKSTPLLTLVTAQETPRIGEYIAWILGGPRTTVLITMPQREYTGEKVHSMYDIFYKGIYLIPTVVNFGNLVNDRTLTFKIWNAEFVSHTLTGFAAANDDGLTLETIGFPVTFGPLHVRTYSIDASTVGPANIDAAYTFFWNDYPDLILSVTGVRVVAFSFRPNWANGVLERLSWMTSIATSDTGAEQRSEIRQYPRREFEADIILHDYDRQYYESVMYAWGGRAWLLPIWPDVQELQSIANAGSTRVDVPTEHRDFAVGGFILLRGENAVDVEVAEIIAVDANGVDLAGGLGLTWPQGTAVYPARPARFIVEPSARRVTDMLHSVSVQFLIDDACDWPATLPTDTYRSYPVLLERPDEAEDLTRTYRRLLVSLDNEIGLPRVTDTANRAFSVLGYRWFLAGAERADEYRQLLYALRGRMQAIWVPTHGMDLTIVSPVALSDTYIFVRNIGWSKYGGAGRRDIRIELADGTAFMRRVVAGTQISTSVERLDLDSAIGQAVAVDQVARISWMNLYRLDTDTVELQHETDIEGLTLSQSIFKEVIDDEL